METLEDLKKERNEAEKKICEILREFEARFGEESAWQITICRFNGSCAAGPISTIKIDVVIR